MHNGYASIPIICLNSCDMDKLCNINLGEIGLCNIYIYISKLTSKNIIIQTVHEFHIVQSEDTGFGETIKPGMLAWYQ